MIVQRRPTASPDPMPWSLGSSAVVPRTIEESLEQGAAALSEDAFSVNHALAQLVEQLEALRTSEEVPEVFDLQPLSRRRVTAHIVRRSRAQFRFIDDDSELLLDD